MLTRYARQPVTRPSSHETLHLPLAPSHSKANTSRIHHGIPTRNGKIPPRNATVISIFFFFTLRSSLNGANGDYSSQAAYGHNTPVCVCLGICVCMCVCVCVRVCVGAVVHVCAPQSPYVSYRKCDESINTQLLKIKTGHLSRSFAGFAIK